MISVILFLTSARTSSCLASRSNYSTKLTNRILRLRNVNMLESAISSSAPSASSKISSYFDNRNIRSLPIDPIKDTYSRQVPNAIFSLVHPDPLHNPQIISFSPSALELLGIDASLYDSSELASLFSGNKLFDGSETYSHCYCGHQFGSFAGQLGDGAAIALGELVNAAGERWELQLKGAGKTPYSRSADGRKVLRSTVREYLCSEGMHHLGVPSTRAGACVTSDSTVQRDPLYDGTVINERCTVVARISPNFFRIGSFEIFKGRGDGDARSGPSAGNTALLRKLADHIISGYYPTLWALDRGRYRAFLDEVVDRTAKLVAKWQTVGFVHGVLNTDNISIMGLTIDYGPFGFMEHFDPEFVPNGSDGSGRYSYSGQPAACKWALLRLAEALAPLLAEDAGGEVGAVRAEVDRRFEAVFEAEYTTLMRDKLGLLSPSPGDASLMTGLFDVMGACSSDFTDTFRALTHFAGGEMRQEDVDLLVDRLVLRSAKPETIVSTLRRKIKISRPSMPPQQTMYIWDLLQSDPDKINEMFAGPVDEIRVEIEAEKRKLDGIVAASQQAERMKTLSAEDKGRSDRALWSDWVSKYADRLRAEEGPDSGAQGPGERRAFRSSVMNRSNPTFILRNWVAQEAIADAEKGDFRGVNTLLRMLTQPYHQAYDCFQHTACAGVDEVPVDARRFLGDSPDWAAGLICTCSS